MSAGTMGNPTMILQPISFALSPITKYPIQKPKKIPIVMNNWLRVPAGPPIAPGNTEVKYVGTRIVFMPATNPKITREKAWVETDKLSTPMNAAMIVR